MSEKIVSLDIRRGEAVAIDLAAMLPLSLAHPIRHKSEDDMVDDMSKWRGDVDIFEVPTIQISRFRHFEALDLAHPDIFSRRSGKKHRKRHINLVKPLYIPYGALDVRLMRKVVSEKRYFDIFTRSLSRSLMIRRRVKATKKFLKKNKRGIVGVFSTIFILTVPVLWYVKFSLEDGYEKFLSLSSVRSIAEARQVVASARTSFERAHFLFIPYSWIPLGPIDLARRASEGGLDIARSADTILSMIPSGTGATSSEKSDTTDSLYRAKAEDIFPLQKIGIDTPTDWIHTHKDELVQASNQIQQAASLFSSTDDGSEIADKMRRVGKGLTKVSSYLSWYFENEDNVLNMLGDANPARYIVFNQNRDEIRANGGFPGTVISFTLYKGNILDFRKDDVYYYDWNLYPYKEQPPPGLTLLTDTYGLRDVNYYPDFRDTVEKANNFIERSGDSTITTGIAIHQGLIEDILGEVGPVSVSGITIPFDAKNFSALMSTLVEAEYGRELHAKEALFDFIPAFIAKIKETRKYDVILNVLEKHWKDGEILIASRDDTVDTFLSQYKKKLPWECTGTMNNEQGTMDNSGALDASGGTYPKLSTQNPQFSTCSRNWAYPIFTSVSGNKSDRYTKRKYAATTKKIEGCAYENTLTITDTHTFSSTDKQTIKSYIKEFKITDPIIQNKVDFVEGNSPNKAFVRVYVPIGSTLQNPGGSIKAEMGDHATVFSFMLETPVGGSASKTIRYTTEIPHCVDYTGSVTWYRQPGLREVEMR